MDQAEAEAHLPDQLLPENDGVILPNYNLVDLQDLQQGSFYYMGGKGFAAVTMYDCLVEYEGTQGNNYVFTFYKVRSKDPLGLWVDDFGHGWEYPIQKFQNREIRLYTYNPGINMDTNGGAYKRVKSYKSRKATCKATCKATRKATRKANKKRRRKTRRNH